MKYLDTFANVTWDARKQMERNPDLNVSTGEVVQAIYSASNGDVYTRLTDWEAWFAEENESGADTSIEDVYDLITELENIEVVKREVADNTFNYGGMFDGALDYRLLYLDDKVIALVKIHLGGDVRGNYTDFFALEFDNDYDFYEAMSVTKTVIVKGYECVVSAMHEGIECSKPNSDVSHTVYAYDMQDLTEALATIEE